MFTVAGTSPTTRGIAFTPDCKSAIVADDNGELRVFDLELKEPIFVSRPHNRIAGMALSAKWKMLVTVPLFGNEPIKVWTVMTKTVERAPAVSVVH
jgi:hypothetical protein